MEKLIKLLNEYAHTDFVEYKDWCFNEKFMWEAWMWYSDVEVISKDFWFIQRLVKNCKIDFNSIKRIILNYEVEDNEAIEYYDLDFATKEETLLMLLAISDNPISDLISYLK